MQCTFFSSVFQLILNLSDLMRFNEGLDGGVWYSLFIKNLAHYSSH